MRGRCFDVQAKNKPMKKNFLVVVFVLLISEVERSLSGTVTSLWRDRIAWSLWRIGSARLLLGNRRRRPVCSSSSKKFVPLKCRKNEAYLEIKETTKCVGSSNEKEMLMLDHRTSLEEDSWLRCFVPTRLWKVGWSGMALSGESNEFRIGNWIAIAS